MDLPPPPGLRPPVEWGTETRLRELFGDRITDLRVTPKEFVFRFASAADFADYFRVNYGPTLKAWELGNLLISRLDFVQVAKPHLRRLNETLEAQVFLEHDRTQRVGHIDAVNITPSQLSVAGVISASGRAAQEVQADAAAGAGLILPSVFISALIQRRDLREEDKSTVFWISAVVGLLLMLGGYALSGPLAAFYERFGFLTPADGLLGMSRRVGR